jgi:hypothetical protein
MKFDGGRVKAGLASSEEPTGLYVYSPDEPFSAESDTDDAQSPGARKAMPVVDQRKVSVKTVCRGVN